MPRKQSYLVQDPERVEVLRLAWDLLLTGNYTMKQICQELHKRGYTRRSGKPWVKVDPETGKKNFGSGISHLHRTFHMPFYAGWVVSDRYNIKRGDVKGHWKPIVSDEEFDRGIEILRNHDQLRPRVRNHSYLCTSILYMACEINNEERKIKMYGSTPTGRSRSYSYYITTKHVDERKIRIPVEQVDAQILDAIEKIQVSPEAIPEIKHLYREHLATLKGPTVEERITELGQRIERLKEEEAALARLYARGKLTDENYDSLHFEWRNKMFETQREIGHLESDTSERVDDLDHALVLLTLISTIFDRLEIKGKRRILQILFKRIIIDTQGKITRILLNPPFEYLVSLPRDPGGHENPLPNGVGSTPLRSTQPDETCSNRPA